jgi:hypothetical protein
MTSAMCLWVSGSWTPSAIIPFMIKSGIAAAIRLAKARSGRLVQSFEKVTHDSTPKIA